MKKKAFIVLVIITCLILLLNLDNIRQKKQIVKYRTIDTKIGIEDFHVGNQAIFMWGSDYLIISDKEGDIKKKERFPSDDCKVFYTDRECYLFREDEKIAYQYSHNGEVLDKIKVPGELIGVKFQNANTIFHVLSDDSETLYSLSSENSLNKVYESTNKILCYDIIRDDNYAICELSIGAEGYKSILKSFGKREFEMNFSNEVAFELKKEKFITLITNNTLYKIYDDERFKQKEIPNISDIMLDKERVYLLHSGIISEFNSNLDENKLIIAANVDKMKKISNSIYVYGKSDIGAEIGKEDEFYTRLGMSLDKIDINGLTIGALKDGELSVYKISNEKQHEGIAVEKE